MKKTWIALAAVPMFLLAGCGTAGNTANTPNPTTSPTNTQTQNTSGNTSGSSTNTTSTAANTANTSTSTTKAPALKQQEIDLTVLPGGRLGTDGKMHDTYAPANWTVVAGVPVKLTIYNYDNMKHSLTSSSLGLNVQANPSAKTGVPGVTTVTFTPTKTGDFNWQCIDPCDLDNNGWAMTQPGFMEGTIHVVAPDDKQYIYMTIKDGLKYASVDGKEHDAFSSTDMTVQAGIPVVVTVENFDTGGHSFTSKTLGVNQVFKGATKAGAPSTTTFTFTPTKAGKFEWNCVIPCDGAGSGGPYAGWAMKHDGYMLGYVTVVK